MRTLTARDLNRALLARQCLLEPSTRPLARVLAQMGGLQAQYAPAMYVGLWSRMAVLKREQVTTALENRTVVQGTLLRVTIHLVTAADYWPVALAVRQARREQILRTNRKGPTAAQYERAAAKLRAALAGGPMKRAEIDKLLGPEYRTGVGLWLDLVRVPPSGTWERRRADLYGLAEDWVGPPTGTPTDGVELLVRRYLGAFGPATRASVADWAGLPVATVAPVLDRLAPRRFRAEDGAELYDLPRAPLPDPQTPAPVRFLPNWDAALLVHARRALVLPEEYRPLVFHVRNPHSVSTFLVDGAVAGTWRYESSRSGEGRIVIEEYRRLPASVRREVDDEAARLVAFHS